MNQVQIQTLTIVLQCEQKQKIFTVQMEADTTISEISNLLTDSLDCRADERLVLYFQNRELEIDSTLEQNEIVKGSRIEIKIVKIQRNASNNLNQQNIPNSNGSEEISLSIEVPLLIKTYTIKMSLNKQIKDLSTEIQRLLDLGSDQIVTFMFKGKSLVREEETLEQSGLTNNSKLNANIVRIGGF